MSNNINSHSETCSRNRTGKDISYYTLLTESFELKLIMAHACPPLFLNRALVAQAAALFGIQAVTFVDIVLLTHRFPRAAVLIPVAVRLSSIVS